MGGRTKDIKRVWRYYTLADYEKEEQFLSKMAAQGWRFVDTNGFRYTFERCEPEQVVYRIDFSGLDLNERDDYYAMFRDFGWEYLQDFNGFSYFCKNGKGVSEDELEIFSDNSSRIEMMKRVILSKLLPVLVMWLGAGMILSTRFLNNILSDSMDAGDWAMTIGYALLLLFTSAVATRMIVGFARLKNKYRKAE